MLEFFDRARKKRADGEGGFTLIELLVVVVILGILIAIAIPVYLNYRKSANDKAAQSDLRGAISQLEVCNSGGAYPIKVATGTSGTMTGCGDVGNAGTQNLPLSTGTSITLYSPVGSDGKAVTSGAPVSFTMETTNASGTSGKFYCYNSANGGSISSPSTGTAGC